MELQKNGTAPSASETVFFIEDQVAYRHEQHAYAVREVTRENAARLGKINREIAALLETVRRGSDPVSLQPLYASYNAIIEGAGARLHVATDRPHQIGSIVEKNMSRAITPKERLRG